MIEHYAEGMANVFDRSWFIYVEQYTPTDIERACSALWGDKGARRYKKLLEELRNQRRIMQRLAVVTTANMPENHNPLASRHERIE